MATIAAPSEPARPLAELQRELVNLRFGMFVHYSPCTYQEMSERLRSDHAMPQQGKDGKLGTSDDVSAALMNPTKLDCGQWADAAKSAGMTFGVLTTKHHDGFCLWPSKVSNYTVAQGCQRDIVGEFAQAFRSRGLKVGLYYSIRDRTANIGNPENGGVSPEKIQLIKDQLTELLSNYGPILYVVFDAWGNDWHESPTFSDIPYAEIYNHIKALQPNCLVLNHSILRQIGDVLQIELHAGMSLPPVADWPAVGGHTLQEHWFWRKEYPKQELRSVQWIVNEHLLPYSTRNVVFQLNCAPNPDGLMDENVVKRLAEVGKAWRLPAPLTTIPDSWKDWPTPSVLKPFQGENIAKGKSAKAVSGEKVISADALTDGETRTITEVEPNGFWEIDLGKAQQIAGIHIWNRPIYKLVFERGAILVSEKPFETNDLAKAQKGPGVKTIQINEVPAYPNPYEVNARGRYIRIVSIGPRKANLGEVEVFVK